MLDERGGVSDNPAMPFLSERDDARDLNDPGLDGIRGESLFLGHGPGAAEVAQFASASAPSNAQLRQLHQCRQNRRPTPVLIVVTHGRDRAALATQFGNDWFIRDDVDRSQAERLSAAVLDAPDRHAADALLRSKTAQLDQPIPGLRNAGLFALHELEHGVPRRADWTEARNASRPLLQKRGRDLIERLGFVIEAMPHPVSVLRARGTRTAIAVFLERSDEIEPASQKYDGLSPVSYALAKADAENLEYVVVAAGSLLRVYPVKPSVGTARRGRTETFVELDLALLSEDAAGYLHLLASPSALAPGGTFTEILEASRRFAADLGARLRERIYEDVMPRLTTAFYRARRLRSPSREKLQETFEMALLTLFRMLFIAYAEDKELLPYHTSDTYREHSLKRMAQRLAEEKARAETYGVGDFYWTEVVQLWKAVDQGNRPWRVPPYNGGLFASGDSASSAARLLSGVELSDAEFAPAMAALLLEQTAEGTWGPVDFRALGVREFGTIYEGLLEQELSVAEQDLAIDPKTSAYVPARAVRSPRAERGGREPKVGERAMASSRAAERTVREANGPRTIVAEGQPYLHDKSGARKSSGAYYTKDFAVEHLLERALEPALADHLARLDAIYDPREAADRFFDFHVADIAMGSGHFLVAAVDHLERGLSGYLAKRPLPDVRDELARLRKRALDELGDGWRGEPIEDTQLLRRQIARRCIHGVDLNPLAVELARLSLWIHTFVPGLPLSFLDANLVIGNSLVGIATLDEARELLVEENLFGVTADELLGDARAPLAKLGKLAEATAAEVKQARELYEKVKRSVADANDLFTVLAASRVDEELADRVREGNIATQFTGEGTLHRDAWTRRAERALKGLRVLHFPVAFPQVFLRKDRPGFDVILGNPPWQEATVEELAFWARHDPGLRGLDRREQGAGVAQLRRSRPDLIPLLDEEKAEAERLRAVLTTGPYPGMGTGDPDLYKAFAWRFWSLVAEEGGRIGVVLPRSAFAAKGTAEFRERLFAAAAEVDLMMLLNNQQWVFPEVHPQYTIGLAVITRGRPRTAGAAILLEGPYASYQSFMSRKSRVAEPTRFAGNEVKTWNDTSSLPLLPAPESADVFLKLRRAPRLDLDDGRSWRARPYAELHATNDADLMDLESERRPRGYWPVFKGESFDIWTPDTGTYYGWAEPRRVTEALQEKRLRARGAASPFSEFPAEWCADPRTLPCQHARIAFRDITNRTNQRTVIAALIPPKVVLTNKAPYLLWPRGTVRDQAFLLGVLSSLPLDWYARRFVEVSLNYFVFNPFPIPRPAASDHLFEIASSVAARLAVQDDDRFEEWGAALGIQPTEISSEEKDDLIHQLDAVVARLYGLDEADLGHIFETFHEGWDYQDRLDRTLAHFWGMGV